MNARVMDRQMEWIRQSRGYLRAMGPAWVISAVACGPATLASVATAGARYGYDMLWVVVLSAVFGTTAQYLAAKIGIVSGAGIIRTTEKHLGPVWAWILTLDALIATWLAAMVLMNALAGLTGMLTGIQTPYWGVFYGILIGGLINWRGYRRFETLCKMLVGFVVACFIVVLGMSAPDPVRMFSGLVPRIPGGVDAALLAAAIMGGAVHITIIGMHTYTTNARQWRVRDLGLARFDTLISMGAAFGVYSLAIFVVSAAALHPHQITVARATDVAMALDPILGRHAMHIFLIGLLAAAFSTIAPTFLAGAFFLADRRHWPLTVKDRRFVAIVWLGCAISMLGPLVKGGFFLLLPLMLALGLVGTPVIIAIILFLLNRADMRRDAPSGVLVNVMGVLTLLVTTFLALRFVVSKIGM
jgi:manganese transport protein